MSVYGYHQGNDLCKGSDKNKEVGREKEGKK